MKRVILLSVSILLISLAYSFAEVPCKINYQGRLIKDNVPVDGTVEMEFKIYDTQDVGTGTKLWGSGKVNVPVHNGLFRYVLGSDGGDLSSIDWTAGETLYLEVKIETDILTPREPIYAYPYAINSHLLEGETKDYFLDTSGETQKKDGGLNIMGNVGIGTTDPQGYKLYVAGDILSSTGKFYNVDKNDYIEIRASDESIRFFTQDAEKLTILNSGNVGIGTNVPEAKLHIAGAGNGIMFPDGTLQTTAPRAPTITVINATANTEYTLNHTGYVKIECFYTGYYHGKSNITIDFQVDDVSIKKITQSSIDYRNWPSLSAVYYGQKSGNFKFELQKGITTQKALQFVITEY